MYSCLLCCGLIDHRCVGLFLGCSVPLICVCFGALFCVCLITTPCLVFNISVDNIFILLSRVSWKLWIHLSLHLQTKAVSYIFRKHLESDHISPLLCQHSNSSPSFLSWAIAIASKLISWGFLLLHILPFTFNMEIWVVF